MDFPSKPTAAKTPRLYPPGEVSSDSEEDISGFDSPRAPVSLVFPQSDYGYLPRAKSDRIEGPRNNRIALHHLPFTSRLGRHGRSAGSALLKKTLTLSFNTSPNLKMYPFPVLKIGNNQSIAADWDPEIGVDSSDRDVSCLETLRECFSTNRADIIRSCRVVQPTRHHLA